MDVSIIIVNYNTLKLTKQTIDSILLQTNGINTEIILIDNASSDGSKEYFSNYYSEKIILIVNKENIGFGRANNIGIKLAKGKYIFLLNSDTILLNNAVKILFDFMEKNERVGVVGGNLYDIDNKPTISYELELPGNELISLVKSKIWRNLNRKFNTGNKPLEVGYVCGADMMIRKNILEDIGYFDPDFFMYYEETELTARIRKRGYKIYNVPTAKIIHLEGKSSEFKEKREHLIHESRYKYYYKVYGEKSMVFSYYSLQIIYLILLILRREENYYRKLCINREEYFNFKNMLKREKIIYK